MTRREQGSATIWIVAVIAVIALVTGVVVSVGVVMLDRHRAAAAADETALAVAAAALDGPTIACGRGSRIARRNGAALTSCRLADAISEVEVEVRLPGWLHRFETAVGRARAGPASAD